MQVQSLRPPEGNSLCKNTSYDVFIVKICDPLGAYNAPQILYSAVRANPPYSHPLDAFVVCF